MLYPNRSPALNLESMEYYYIYYCGFGAPFAITVGLFPILIGNGVFAFLFPAFIIMAAGAEPRRPKREEQFRMLPTRVLIFNQAAWLNDRTLGFLLRLKSSRKSNSHPSTPVSRASSTLSSVATSAARSAAPPTEHLEGPNSVAHYDTNAAVLQPPPSSSLSSAAFVVERPSSLSLSASDVDASNFLPPGSDAVDHASSLASKKNN